MTNVNNTLNQCELKANTRNPLQARENACDQVAIGFGFSCDWLRMWREIFKPIIARSKAKPKQFSDYFRQSTALSGQRNCKFLVKVRGFYFKVTAGFGCRVLLITTVFLIQSGEQAASFPLFFPPG